MKIIKLLILFIISGLSNNCYTANLNINQTFINAATRGDLETVQNFLHQYDLNIDVKDSNGYTSLILASEYDHIEMVQLLLKYGADVNEKSNIGWTALMLASSYGHSEVVKLLLRNGADVNAKVKSYNYGSCPCYGRHQNHANIENGLGATALMHAVYKENISIVKILLEHGADVNAKNPCNETALMIACCNKFLWIVKLLLLQPNINVNAKDKNDNTALHHVYGKYNEPKEIVELLLSAGADVDAINNEGKTAFMNASINEDTGIMNVIDCYKNKYIKYINDKQNVKDDILEAIPSLPVDLANIISEYYVKPTFLEYLKILDDQSYKCSIQ